MKRFTNSRKFLFGLAVSMVLAMAIGSFALGEGQTQAIPQAVEAQSAVGATAGPFTVNGGTQGTDYDYASSVLTIHSGNLTISTTAQTSERIVVDGAATITLAGVNIDRSSEAEVTAPITITDDATFDVNILLADGSTNILKGRAGTSSVDPGSPGIQKNGDIGVGTLTIGVPDGSTGTGKLEATGGRYAAGIGGGNDGSGSNITISGGEVTANGGYDGAGIGGGWSRSGSYITITGGVVTANGGSSGAGIGGGYNGSGNDITISGGEVTANGGNCGAGIGGGYQGSGSDITITGCEVTVNGGDYAAGIGGGYYGNGSNITITGGVVTAYGGKNAAGIGGGSSGSGSGNSLNGDAVVLATSGDASKAALEGFADSDLNRGITFTRQTTSGTWSGTMYGDSVTISQNVEFPADLTIGTNQSNPQELIVDTNVTLTISAGATLQNDGTITINNTGTIDCQGTITTKTDFYLDDGSLYNTGYQTYKTNAGVQKYTNLPNPDQTFINWYYVDQDGRKTKIDENSFVALNAHSFYENLYAISIAKQGEGEITPNVTEAAKDDTVTFEATPADGYQLKEGSLIVTDADGNEVPVTEEDGKYTFTMPGADVEISAEFELLPTPEPSVDPDQGDGSDASSKTGDSFTGIAALAILGVATTGTVLLRKRK